MKIRVFWDVATCTVGVNRRFRGTYCPHNNPDRPDNGGSTHLLHVGHFNQTTGSYISENSNF
jgi:hypothetical protein